GRRAADVEQARSRCAARGHGWQRDRGGPVLRQVAQAEVGAALEPEIQVEGLDWAGTLVRNRDREFAAIDFLLAEELVRVRLATRERRRADCDAVGAAVETESRAVQVEPVEYGKIEIDALGIRARRVLEHFLGWPRIL